MQSLFEHCFQQYADDSFFFLQKCVKDTLSPISIKLNFSQVDSESASAVLNMDSKRQAEVEVCTAEGCS